MGTAYLVGAGPGDPKLITRRGAELLRRADVVLHDALVGQGLLELANPAAEMIDAGRRAGESRWLNQGRINRLLVTLTRQHAIVVRLKGGDPLVFGRGGEEALALVNAGVPFEIVPGVTAGVGALACAGIPLTHRSLSTSVVFVTAHDREDPESEIRALAADALATLEVVVEGAVLVANAATLLPPIWISVRLFPIFCDVVIDEHFYNDAVYSFVLYKSIFFV